MSVTPFPPGHLTQLASGALLLALAVLALSTAMSVTPQFPAVGVREDAAAEHYGQLPLHFEPAANRVTVDRALGFVARGAGYAVRLSSASAEFAVGKNVSRRKSLSASREPTSSLRMHLVGARQEAQSLPEDRLSGVSHYLLGRDTREWRTYVPHYARVRWTEVYPGVDVVYYGTDRKGLSSSDAGPSLEYDFIVSPGASSEQIRLAFAGAERMEITASGDLLLHTSGGVLRQHRPRIYQERNGVRETVPGEYVLLPEAPRSDGPAVDNAAGLGLAGTAQVGFRIGTYDKSRPLVIDPVLSFSTYLGAAGEDQAFGVAVDGEGSAYITGGTDSAAFPTAGPAQDSQGGESDAFVSKLSPDGKRLIYSTYLGGSGLDVGYAVAVDRTGAAYVTGATDSADFPTELPLQSGGWGDAFVTKLQPDGAAAVYSTYLGGDGDDAGRGIAVDAAGAAYVTGNTHSSDFPVTPGALKATADGSIDAFVTKINHTGTALTYSTRLGGSNDEQVTFAGVFAGIAVDPQGNAWIAGSTLSANFRVSASAFQRRLRTADTSDAFLAGLNPSGTTLRYATYFGGSGEDFATGVAVDPAGTVYLAGYTGSTDLASTPGAAQTLSRGGGDAFAARFNPARTGAASLVYATYLGGSAPDIAYGVAVDGAGTAHVTGYTRSSTFPRLASLHGFQGTGCAFVSCLDAVGALSGYSTLLSAGGDQAGTAVALASPRAVYVTGGTTATNFRTTSGALDTTANGGTDAFALKLGTPLPAPSSLRATALGTGVQLAWQDNSSDEAVFDIERRAGTGAFAVVGTVPANTKAYLDLEVRERTNYTYRVRARGRDSESLYSELVLVTPPLSPPASLSAAPVSETQVRLSWIDTSTVEGGFRIQRRTGTGAYAVVGASAANSTSFLDSRLTKNTKYTYRVLAFNAAGSSAPSNEAEATPGTLNGLAPGLLGEYFNNSDFTAPVLTRNDPTIDFQWGYGSPHRDLGSDTFSVRWTGYVKARYSQTYTFHTVANNGVRLWVNGQKVIDHWANDSTAEDSGTLVLTAGRHYALRMELFENTGTATARLFWSSTSQPREVVPSSQLYSLPAPLPAPTGLTGRAPSSGEVSLEWSDLQGEAGYRVERRVGTAGEFRLVASLPADLRSWSDTGVSAGSQYSYRVRGRNGAGVSPPSAEVTVSVLVPPDGLTVTPRSATEVRLTWTDRSTAERGFRIERRSGGGEFVQVDTASANATSDYRLLPGTLYVYRIRAYDASGVSNYSPEVSYLPLTAPTGLQGQATSTSQIALQWTNTGTGRTGVMLERRAGSGPFLEIASLGPEAAALVDNGLRPGVIYTYRVRVISRSLTPPAVSAYSNQVALTTLPFNP